MQSLSTFRHKIRTKLKTEGQSTVSRTDRQRPPYLATSCPNTLSIEPFTDESIFQTVYDQNQSLFFSKLPPELRAAILGFIFGGRIFHIDFAYQPLKGNQFWDLPWVLPPSQQVDGCWQWWHSVCMEPRSAVLEERKMDEWFNDWCHGKQHQARISASMSQRKKKSNKPAAHKESKLTLDLSCLTVCKKLYMEAIPVIYSSNTFSFERSHLLSTQLSKLWPRNHYDMLTSIDILWSLVPHTCPYPITTIEFMKAHPEKAKTAEGAFEGYDALWETLSEMPGLRNLRVKLHSFYLTEDVPKGENEYQTFRMEIPVEEYRRAWLRPIERLRDKHLNYFELVLGYTWVLAMWDRERAYLSTLLDARRAAGPVGNELFILISHFDLPTICRFPQAG